MEYNFMIFFKNITIFIKITENRFVAEVNEMLQKDKVLCKGEEI